MKQLRYALEAFLFSFLMLICRLMPVQCASSFLGKTMRLMGPKMGASKKALDHIAQSLPDKNAEHYKAILADMWDNLGRIVAEYPHLETICRKHTELEDNAGLEAVFKTGKPIIFISAHLGNWEVLTPYFRMHYGQAIAATYRSPNNPFVDKLIERMRGFHKEENIAFPKERASAPKLLRHLKDGKYVGILIDQKFNEGVSVPFFGRPAMTNPAFVQLSQKTDAIVIPAQIIRGDGCNFKIVVHKPIETKTSEEKNLPLENVIKEAHLKLEEWIKDHPGQWLWLHKRWASRALTDDSD